MNRFDKLFGLKGEAKVKYLDGDFQVVVPGDFVRCAVTDARINLPDLRYWNVELQEAYASAAVSLQRYRSLRQEARREQSHGGQSQGGQDDPQAK